MKNNKSKKNRKLFMFAILLLLPIFFYIFTKSFLPNNSSTYEIVLSSGGFQPSEITIEKDDTVIFRTESGNSFWPASNEHPVHTDFPEFDPKRSLQPQESWSFQFREVGIYNFHDHLNPYFRGTITVIE